MKKLIASLAIICGAALIGAAEPVAWTTLEKDFNQPGEKIVWQGWFKIAGAADVENKPYISKRKNSHIGAMPYNKHCLEFMLAKPGKNSRIVINLERTVANHKIAASNFAQAKVFVSNDGQKFTAVPTEVSSVIYTNSDKGGALVTLKGDFNGRYLRIYMPWYSAGYAYKLELNKSYKIYAK